jgi:hypothetical protein
MDWWQILVLVVSLTALAGFAWYVKFRNRDPQIIKNNLVTAGIDPKRYANFQKSYTTPRGIAVKSTAPVPPAFLQIIDASIERMIRNHRRAQPTWTKHVNIPDYAVLLIDPMTTNVETEPGSPALLVKGVQTAGTVIGYHPQANLSRPHIVAPHQDEQDWRFQSYFAHTIYNEGEHVIESQNDWGIFMHYAHAGDVHPHVGDEMVGLKAQVQPPCAMPADVKV